MRRGAKQESFKRQQQQKQHGSITPRDTSTIIKNLQISVEGTNQRSKEPQVKLSKPKLNNRGVGGGGIIGLVRK